MSETKDKILKIVSALNETRDALVKLDIMLSGGPASYYFETIATYIEGLFSFAKFKTGELVCLADDIDCGDKPGWKGSEHFLKKGARATVLEVAYGKDGFSYGVEFEKETFLSDGVPKPVRSKHQYWFRQSELY